MVSKIDAAATASGICDSVSDMGGPFETVVSFPPGGLMLDL
jgi:hypothetical protein